MSESYEWADLIVPLDDSPAYIAAYPNQAHWTRAPADPRAIVIATMRHGQWVWCVAEVEAAHHLAAAALGIIPDDFAD